MSVSSGVVARNIALVGFLFLFPAFLFYHQLVAMGVVPSFLGGLFGVSSLAVLALFALMLPSLLIKESFKSPVPAGGYAAIVIVFAIYATTWTAIFYTLSNFEYSAAAAKQSLETIILWLSLFMIGCFLPLDSSFLKRALMVSFSAILVFLLYYAFATGSAMYVARLAYSAEDVATYQGFARSALLTLCVLLAVERSYFVRCLLIASGFFVMFTLGARSEFYAFCLLALVLSAIWSRRSYKYLLIAVVIASIAVLVLFVNADNLSGSRQLAIVDLADDGSWRARQRLANEAYSQLLESPILGDFGGHFKVGGEGSYVHNLFSSWVNYGLLGFVLYAALIFIPLVASSYRVLLKGNRDPLWMLVLMISFVCSILVLAAKSVFWPVPALAWGLYVNANWNKCVDHKVIARSRIKTYGR